MEQVESEKEKKEEQEEEEDTTDIDQIIDKLQCLKDLIYMNLMFGDLRCLGKLPRSPLYTNHI